MNKKIFKYCVVILIFFAYDSKGQQNLVLNPGFEDTTQCPINTTFIRFAKHWYQPLPVSTSDLWHKCFPNPTYNIASPRNGEAAAGIILFTSNLYDTIRREYICGHLKTPLKQGEKYCVEFYMSLLDWSYYCIVEAGIYFSKDSISKNNPSASVMPFIPQVENKTGWLIDTSGYMKIEGSFIASGGEEHFIIGNFHTSSQTHVTVLSYGNHPAYYMIDDVSVWYCGPDTTSESPDIPVPSDEPVPASIITEPGIPNIFTPNGDGYNDLFVFDSIEGWQFTTIIFNRWGEEVFLSNYKEWWDGTCNGEPCSEGVYFYVVDAISELGTEKKYQGAVTLLR